MQAKHQGILIALSIALAFIVTGENDNKDISVLIYIFYYLFTKKTELWRYDPGRGRKIPGGTNSRIAGCS